MLVCITSRLLKLLTEAELQADAPFRIVDVAAGLRHAVAAISVEAQGDQPARLLSVGWGSARQGQVGKVPAAAAKTPGTSKRPGPAPAVVAEPQLIFNWKTEALQSTECKVRAVEIIRSSWCRGRRRGGRGVALHRIKQARPESRYVCIAGASRLDGRDRRCDLQLD